MKKMLAVLTLSFVLALYPAKAYACDSLLCLGDIFGTTEIAKRDAERREKQAETERQRTVDVARINADASARIAEANRQLEAQRIQGKISEAQAKALADGFAAAVNAKRDEAIAGITQNALVAIAGINQTGETERSRVGWDAKSSMFAVAIIGILVLAGLGVGAYILINYLNRSQQAPKIVFMLPGTPERAQLDQRNTVYLPNNHYMIDQKDTDR